MPRDTDAEMLVSMGSAVIELQRKFRQSTLEERMTIRPALEEMLEDYTEYELKLLKEGVITTDSDLAEFDTIRREIDEAAGKQAILLGIARVIGFVAMRV